jgi:hypothetical protein
MVFIVPLEHWNLLVEAHSHHLGHFQDSFKKNSRAKLFFCPCLKAWWNNGAELCTNPYFVTLIF